MFRPVASFARRISSWFKWLGTSTASKPAARTSLNFSIQDNERPAGGKAPMKYPLRYLRGAPGALCAIAGVPAIAAAPVAAASLMKSRRIMKISLVRRRRLPLVQGERRRAQRADVFAERRMDDLRGRRPGARQHSGDRLAQRIQKGFPQRGQLPGQDDLQGIHGEDEIGQRAAEGLGHLLQNLQREGIPVPPG